MEKAKSKAERNLAKKTKFKETKAKDDFAAKLSVPQGTQRPFAAKGARVLQTVHRWIPAINARKWLISFINFLARDLMYVLNVSPSASPNEAFR